MGLGLISSLVDEKKEKKAKPNQCQSSTLVFYQQEKTIALMEFFKI
jgi:hypothetical protein